MSDKIKKKIIEYKEYIVAIVGIIVGIVFLSITAVAALAGDDCVNVPYYYHKAKTDYPFILESVFGGIYKAFTFQTGRFFPLNFPSLCVYSFFFKNLFTYRLYIIVFTYIVIVAVAVFLSKNIEEKQNAWVFLAIMPLMICIWYQPANNGMYSYMGLPQSTLFPMVVAGITTLLWWNKEKKLRYIWLPIFCSFFSCASYELGYIFGVVVVVFLWYKVKNFKDWICISFPIGMGELLCLIMYVVNQRRNYVGTGSEASTLISLQWDSVFKAFWYQAAAGLPWSTIKAAGIPFQNATKMDYALSLLIALCVAYFAYKADSFNIKKFIFVGLFGLFMWLLPAALMSITLKYQQEHWINASQGYIPAVVESIGVGIVASDLICAISYFCKKISKYLQIVFLCCLIFALTRGGAYQRSAVRNTWSLGGDTYNCMMDSLEDGLLEGVTDNDLVVGYFTVWGDSNEAHSVVIESYADIVTSTMYYANYLPENSVNYEKVYAYGEGYSSSCKCLFMWQGEIDKNTLDNVVYNNSKIYIPKKHYSDKCSLSYTVYVNGEVTVKVIPFSKIEKKKTENGYFLMVEDNSVSGYSVINEKKAVSEFLKRIEDGEGCKLSKKEHKKICKGLRKDKEASFDKVFEIIDNKDISDEQYISNLYSYILGRVCSEEELQMWMNNFENGSSRYDIFWAFVSCDEFKNGRGW